MIRIATTVLCAVSLSACANLPDWIAAHQFLNGDAHRTAPASAQYSFDWSLSGERQVAPLQVFDDGEKTWLHFLPDQIAPAIFQHTEQGQQLLPYVRQGDYLVLDGVWPVLSFRGGGLSASAHKQGPDAGLRVDAVLSSLAKLDDDVVSHASPITVATDTSISVTMSTESLSDVPEQGDGTAVPGLHDDDGETGHIRVDETSIHSVSDDARRLTDASFERIEQPAYAVWLHDQNLRQALHRWAAQADWTFAPEHWDVDVDIPISGEADFHGTFQDAVQDVLASTELADRPLRPCFYSNRVLRVVAYAQSCDRSGAQTS